MGMGGGRGIHIGMRFRKPLCSQFGESLNKLGKFSQFATMNPWLLLVNKPPGDLLFISGSTTTAK